MTSATTHPAAISALVWIAIAIAVVARFGFRELRERRVRLARLFIVPVVFGIVALTLIVAAGALAPHGLGALAGATVAGVVVGAAAGVGVARFTTVRSGGEPGIVYVRGSLATLAIWIAALALRMVARFNVGTHDAGNTAIANAALVVLLATAITIVRYRIYVEARVARARGAMGERTAV